MSFAIAQRVRERATGAVFSEDYAYRYLLWRQITPGTRIVTFVGLNPSTADADSDDPTIRRCRSFASAWGYDTLCVVNLFAFRATFPEDMKRVLDPVGEQNDQWLAAVAEESSLVLACWGNHGTWRSRYREAQALLPQMHCLGKTALRQPKHPLYLRSTETPVAFNAKE